MGSWVKYPLKRQKANTKIPISNEANVLFDDILDRNEKRMATETTVTIEIKPKTAERKSA